jgi:hypothetical protein
MRNFAHTNAEPLIIISLFAIFGLLKAAAANQIAYLNLYFIPVLVSGYFLGRRRAMLSAGASVLLAVLFLIRWPDELLQAQGRLYANLNILVWASLLMLSSILVSTLNENRHHRQAKITLQLLEKYVRDIAEQDNHPARVGRLSREIAQEMRLPSPIVNSVTAAGYLHDITDSDAGLRLISDCSRIEDSADSPIIGEAIPILSRRHQQPGHPVTAIGPKILTVADLYDTAFSADRNRDLLQVVQYLETETDESFILVIKALLRVIHKKTA